MACAQDLRQLIIDAANAAGIPPAIALSVATQESSICQWNPDGSVKRGKAGEYGVFQLMPATAAKYGVDPTDVYQNIRGGVAYLADLFAQYGDWTRAVAAYNGPANLRALAQGVVPSYVSSVMNRAGVNQAVLQAAQQLPIGAPAVSNVLMATDALTSNAGPAVVMLLVAAGAAWLLMD